MSATLRLTREGFGIELRRGVFDVLVDGQQVGTIELHQVFESEVASGHHTLQLRVGRYSSREEAFDAADGDGVNFRCHGANLWPVWAVSYAVPRLGISLRRE